MNIKNALKLYRFLKNLPESKFDFWTVAESVSKNHKVMAQYLEIDDDDAADLFYKDKNGVKNCKLACLNEFNNLVIQQTNHSLDYWDEYYAKRELVTVRRQKTLRMKKSKKSSKKSRRDSFGRFAR